MAEASVAGEIPDFNGSEAGPLCNVDGGGEEESMLECVVAPFILCREREGA